MDLTALDTEQEEELQAWRAQALAEMPYFASILFNLRVLNAPGLGTWAVDPYFRMYIDFEAVRAKSFRWNTESVMHEASHLFADHATSAKDLGVGPETHKTWNVAADLSINDDLDESGCKTFRDDKMLPEFIGEKNGETPHHYFRVLQKKQEQAKKRRQPEQEQKAPSISLRPRKIKEGEVRGSTVTVTADPAWIDPSDVTLLVTDDAEQPVPYTGFSAGFSGLSFDLVAELPVGGYTVTVTSGDVTASASLVVAGPSIKVIPERIATPWAAPYEVEVKGEFTAFTDSAVVTLAEYRDPDDQTPAARFPTTGTRRVSRTSLLFSIAGPVPDGMYVVEVTDGPVRLGTLLPIGLPHMSVDPAQLPTTYPVGQTLDATVSDFTFDASTTFDVYHLLGFPIPAVSGVKVTSKIAAEITLGTTLPEGPYMLVATTTTASGPQQTAAQFAVTDETAEGDGGGSGGSGESDDEGESKDPFRGCGSGSGGEGWDGELGPNDDFGGLAPAIKDGEKEAIRTATAAALKDHVAKGRGTVPGGLLAIADKVLEPSKTPWQQLLGGAIRGALSRRRGRTHQDMQRRNRRRHNATVRTASGPRRYFVPGTSRPTPRLVIIRDTSGSMGAMDLAVVTREVEGIAKRLGIRGDDLMVWDVDAAVHAKKAYKGKGSIKEVAGRGGTSMTVGIEEVWNAKDAKERPTAIVVLTDGGTDWPTTEGPIPVIAAIVPQGNGAYAENWAEHTPEWVKTIVVDPAGTPR